MKEILEKWIAIREADLKTYDYIIKLVEEGNSAEYIKGFAGNMIEITKEGLKEDRAKLDKYK